MCAELESGFEVQAEREAMGKELLELGIEALPENISAAVEQKNTRQHPEGFEEIFASLDNPNELKRLMLEKGIKSIIHSEGTSVWDHARKAIEEAGSECSEEVKKDLKLIMLYHDLGKTVVYGSEQNVAQTQKKLAKGELGQSMIGHPKERLQDIEAGLRVNGVDSRRLKIFMTVIENHMNTSLLEQDVRKTVKLFETFGTDDEEREQVVRLLTMVLQLDGNATESISLVDGELKYSKNEKKLKLDFDSVWNKYKEGKQALRDEADKKAAQEAEAAFEFSIFGKKLPDYVKQDRGVKPGPDMGKAIGKVKALIAARKGDSPEEIKKLIDAMSL